MSPSPRRRPEATLDLIEDWVIPLEPEKAPEKRLTLTHIQTSMRQAVAQNDHNSPRLQLAANKTNSDNLQVDSEEPATQVPVNLQPPIVR